MSGRELIALSDSIKQYTQQLSNNKEESKKFLKSVGIINKNGKLKKPYRNLCTQLEPA